MKNVIKRIPIIGNIARVIKKKLLPSEDFTTSEQYWIKRYAQGGNSGSGSYNNLAAFKGKIINSFVARQQIEKVAELGCGDGNQLTYFSFPNYIGFDVSEVAIERCRNLFKNDSSKQFFHISRAPEFQADLALSLDVIYHLIEDDIYHAYMTQLFAASTRYVIIYASDDDKPHNYAPHVKTRKFSNWIKNHRPDFHLLEHIPNQFPLEADRSASTSFSDFFIYRK